MMKKYKIALIAHDGKNAELVSFVLQNKERLLYTPLATNPKSAKFLLQDIAHFADKE